MGCRLWGYWWKWPCYNGTALYYQEDLHAGETWYCHDFNTLRPRHYGRRFPDDIFKRIFLNENVWIFDLKFTETCSQESNWQQISIGSGKGLAPNRRKAITCTNADPVHLRIYGAPRGDTMLPALLALHVGNPTVANVFRSEKVSNADLCFLLVTSLNKLFNKWNSQGTSDLRCHGTHVTLL